MGSKLSVGAALLLACVMFSCGDDDDGASGRCPAGSEGDTISCRCDDNDEGMAACGPDGSVGTCRCSGDGGVIAGRGGSSGSGSGGSSASGSGGSSASGSGGTTTSGSGGSTPGPDDDAGQDPPADAGNPDPTTDPTMPPPMDGNQLAACDSDRDCNMNLGCYGGDLGGFCTRVCERDEDCASLQGAEYHCGQSGLCSVECANADDDASCPGDTQCIGFGGGQGQGGGGGFRCLYPQAEPARGGGFAQCMGGGSCQDGLQCIGDSQNQSGFCSHNCTPEDQDCSDVPAPSGALAASCIPQGPEQGVCALDCKANMAGCPTGMECVTQGFYSLCRYPD